MDWNNYKQTSDDEKIQILKSLGKSDNIKGKLSKKRRIGL